MCRRVECEKCGKPSWAGCGAHIEQVLGDVPVADRCRCDEILVKARAPEPQRRQRSWLSRLLGN
jgi:hypothetical protein